MGREYFLDPLYVHTYEQQISFCYHMAISITHSVSLSGCFHPETSFVDDLKFYNGDTKSTLACHKSRLGENLLTFLSVL